MQLKNRFEEEDKIRIWGDHPYCADGGSNNNCSLHHIYGTISDSIFNGIMLSYEKHKKADGENTSTLGNPLRKKYVNIAFEKVTRDDWYQIKPRDIGFLNFAMADLSEKNKILAHEIIWHYNNSK